MKNKLVLIITVVFMLVATVAFAAKESTRVEADRMEYNASDKTSVFYGNVVAYSGKLKISAEKMKVFFKKSKKIQEIYCYDNVKIEQEGSLATSKNAHLVIDTDTVSLTGNVKVWRGKSYFEGEKAVINAKTGQLNVDSGEKKRVKIIFQPED